jgi:hypothetical protein
MLHYASFGSLLTVDMATIVRFQEKIIKFGWDQNREVLSHIDRCAHLDTLRNQRETAKIMFVFDLLSNNFFCLAYLSVFAFHFTIPFRAAPLYRLQHI